MIIAVALLLLIPSAMADPSGGFQWAGHQDIFLQNTSSTTVTGYKVMDHIPKVAPETYITKVVPAGTTVYLGDWIMPIGSPVNGSYTIAPGIWAFHFYTTSTQNNALDKIQVHLLNRSASGVQTDLFYGTALSYDLAASAIPVDTTFEYVRRNFTYCNAGDRLVLNISIVNSGTVQTTDTFHMDGNLHTSRVTSSYWISTGNQFPTSNSASGEAGADLAYSIVAGSVGGAVAIIYWRRRSRR